MTFWTGYQSRCPTTELQETRGTGLELPVTLTEYTSCHVFAMLKIDHQISINSDIFDLS